MKAGIVILNYNTSDETIKLAKLLETYKCFEKIIIVDNGSVDQETKKLRRIQSDTISLIETEINGGYSCGNNIGFSALAKTEVEIIFFSNPDVYVEENDIKLICQYMENNKYSMLSGKEYDINGNLKDIYLSYIPSYLDDLLSCFYVGRIFNKKRHLLRINNEKEINDTGVLHGSFFAVRKSDFESVGGFDENVFLYCEERILASRIKKIGGRIGIVTAAKYKHMHSVSIDKVYPDVHKKMKLLYKSRMYYNKKYNNIGIARIILLFVAMKISLFEFWLRDIYHKIHYK